MNEIVIRPTADANVREYHAEQQLTEAPYVQVLDSELNLGDNFTKLGPNATTLLKHLQGSQGITKLTIRPFSVKVTKDAHVSWGQIEPSILSAFETTFGELQPVFYSKATRQRVLA